MKKLKKLLCLLLAFTIAVSAMSCGRKQTDNDVQTEQNDILTEKSPKPDAENELVDKEPAKEGTFVEEDGTVRQVNTFESEDGWVTFVVNAVVEGYDITELPVVSVVPNHYDSTELKRICEAMAQGNTIYEYSQIWTKTELDRVREDLQGLVDGYLNGTSSNAPYFSEDERKAMAAEWQALIDHLDEDYENAPDVLPYTEPVYEYGPSKRYDMGKDYLEEYFPDASTIFRAVYIEDGRVMEIHAGDNNRTDRAADWGLEGDKTYTVNTNVVFAAVDNKRNDSYGGTYTQKTPFTENEIKHATEKAIAIVDNMDIGEWKLTEVREFPPREGDEDFGYSLAFYFSPVYYGAATNVGSVWVYSTDDHKDVPSFSGSSRIMLSYSNGYFLDIGLDNDVDVISETEPKKLLTYDEALEVIYGYAAKKWDFSSIYAISPYKQVKDENYSYNLYINKISLEYIRTVSGDDPDHYDLIPVWIVYGHPNVVNVRIGNAVIEGMTTYDSKAETNMEPLMAINAYDGTLINSDSLTGNY